MLNMYRMTVKTVKYLEIGTDASCNGASSVCGTTGVLLDDGGVHLGAFACLECYSTINFVDAHVLGEVCQSRVLVTMFAVPVRVYDGNLG